MPVYIQNNKEVYAWQKICTILESEYGDRTKPLDAWAADVSINRLNEYKATNKCLPENWDEVLKQRDGVRIRMFAYDKKGEKSCNGYAFMTVEQKCVDIVAEVSCNVDRRSYCSYEFQKNSIQNNTITPLNPIKDKTRGESTVDITEVFDITELSNNINDLLGKQNWTMKIRVAPGLEDTGSVDNSYLLKKYAITDNLGNEIASCSLDSFTATTLTSTVEKTVSVTTNLKMLDVDYDGKLTISDLEIIFDYVDGNTELSQLQKKLADINQDGVVNQQDISELSNYINQKVFVEKDELVASSTLMSYDAFCAQILDVDLDGKLTIEDCKHLRYYVAGSEELSNIQEIFADINRDGSVDVNDEYELLNYIYEKAFVEKDTSFVSFTKTSFRDLLDMFYICDAKDINIDNVWNKADIDLMRKIVAGQEARIIEKLVADYSNLDGKVDEKDLRYVVNKVCYVDIDGDGKCNEDDVNEYEDYFHGWPLDSVEMEKADLNGDGTITREDEYMLLYGYYLNKEINPDFDHDDFYGTLISSLLYNIGDLNDNDAFDENDLRLLKSALNGDDIDYIFLILADIDQNMILNDNDYSLFTSYYMSDIPFIYSIDETNKTMKITGVKDTGIQFADISDTYCVNAENYTVTEIGDNAFTGCMNLDAAYIPESVTTISCATKEKSPFYGTDDYCVKVYCEASGIPDGFSGCWSSYVDQVRLAYEMKEIADYFYYEADEEYKTLTITGGKGYLYYDEYGCVEIDNQYLLNGEKYQVTAIGESAFYQDSNVTEVILPACLTEIEAKAFSDMNNLCCIEMWACHKLKKMGANVFKDSESIDTVLFFPVSLEEVDSYVVEDSLFWGVPDASVIVRDGAKIEGWGPYWNYIDEENYIEPLVIYP